MTPLNPIMPDSKPLRVSVLLSGSGRTLENLHEAIEKGDLQIEIVQVISSHPDAYGLTRAQNYGIPAITIDYRDYKGSPQDYSQALTEAVETVNPDLIVLAGFLRHWQFPEKYEQKIMNIHPSLLPAFGGKGFYGSRVHQAVLDSGAQFSGCTVHFASQIYDEGPIILQKIVSVSPEDTVETLAQRVFEQECLAYPEAIRLFHEGRLELQDQRIRIRSQ